MSMKEFPRDKGLDNTLEVLLKEGYRYILDKKEELGTNVFETRLLGEKAICLASAKMKLLHSKKNSIMEKFYCSLKNKHTSR